MIRSLLLSTLLVLAAGLLLGASISLGAIVTLHIISGVIGCSKESDVEKPAITLETMILGTDESHNLHSKEQSVL